MSEAELIEMRARLDRLGDLHDLIDIVLSPGQEANPSYLRRELAGPLRPRGGRLRRLGLLPPRNAGDAEGVMSECRCVSCGVCGGTGTVWFAFPGPDMGGKYLGDHRCDDLDEMDTCEECGGSGITETCDSCMLADELEVDE